MMNIMKKHTIITDFLKIVGADREAQRYLKLFHRGDPVRFAVIKIGGAVLEQSMDMIAMDLAYLSKLDLYPVVIHGGGPQIDGELRAQGITFCKIDGQRVTAQEQLTVIHQVLNGLNTRLVSAITEYKGNAFGLMKGIFVTEKHPDQRYGEVGSVKKVNLDPIIQTLKSKKIPIIGCIGNDEQGQLHNINADSAAKALVLALCPRKYLLITEQGGIRDEQGTIISNLNLQDEYDDLERANILCDGMLHKVREIKDLLERLEYNLPVQITSSRGLLRELFTEKGSGTFIKRGGNIKTHAGYNGIDRARLKRLIEKSFGKILRSDYFDKPVDCIFMDHKYRGVAILRRVGNVYYLDKFCVREETQGEGIASDLWCNIDKRDMKIFWRSKPDNPINAWYFRKAAGVLKFSNWYLFWLNLDDQEIACARDHVLSQEESFITS
jgi:acetylglutamate kinase